MKLQAVYLLVFGEKCYTILNFYETNQYFILTPHTLKHLQLVELRANSSVS